MDLDWTRIAPKGASSSRVARERIAAPAAKGSSPWILLVGENEPVLEEAAGEAVAGLGAGLPVLSPPSRPPLPIAVHALPPAGIGGPRVLWTPRLDRAFFATGFSGASPSYLLAMLSRAASEGEPLAVVATALESRLSQEVLAQRGLASRFEIWRVPGEAREEPRAEEELPFLERKLAAGLEASDPGDRARACEEAVSAAPDSALARLLLGASLLERGRPREAADVLRQALALAPDLPAAHYELGKASLQTDDMDGALASFRKTVELLPEFSSGWGNLGAALGEVQDLERAAEALERAVALDPRNAALHSNLGVTHRDRGRLELAEAKLRKTIELDPGFVFGHYNLGSVLFLQGRYPEAIAAFETARSMDPSRSPRQALLLAACRLASGDLEGAWAGYREIFARLEGGMRSDMRAVAEWDLKQLARRTGLRDPIGKAARLVRSLAGPQASNPSVID